ncbi:MAG: preprotein translocase subunit SecY [Candidatus Diapherotrites archaeon]|nr:preprotein translocase subunit SecY [Candidatus Diapherotrites archaeon]
MSILDMFAPIYKLIPEVKTPEVKPSLKNRIIWTAAVMIIFFIMRNVSLIGLNESAKGLIGEYQLILGSEIGSLITIGIGPIVLASIILQLLVGGGIISINMTDPKERAKFTAMQKTFAIFLCFFEAFVYVAIGLLRPAEGMFFFVIFQVAIGAIILMYLDEVVSKYGIGSGISLFIAAGVSYELLWVTLNPFNAAGQFSLAEASGVLFRLIIEIGSNTYGAINWYLLPILFTILVFLIVVFAEGIHVNIPITMGFKGATGRYPVKLLYVSNIPVILAVALFANVKMWAMLAKDVPIVGLILERVASIMTAPHNLRAVLLAQVPYTPITQIASDAINSLILFFNPFNPTSPFTTVGSEPIGAAIVHAIFYLIILILTCVVFGKFWVEMANQGPDAIAEQLEKAGMSIPGFRRDPRVVQKILERYIPTVTILGSAFVAFLAGFADLTGTLASGMGILLTVGIIYRLYEELARLQFMEMHPLLGKILG